MCQICRKLNKGSISVEEAREELDEQAEFLSEEHIEEIEELLCEAEDSYDYIQERKAALLSGEINYQDEEALGESELPDFDEGYNLQEDE
jgi:hypothetical protein